MSPPATAHLCISELLAGSHQLTLQLQQLRLSLPGSGLSCLQLLLQLQPPSTLRPCHAAIMQSMRQSEVWSRNHTQIDDYQKVEWQRHDSGGVTHSHPKTRVLLST